MSARGLVVNSYGTKWGLTTWVNPFPPGLPCDISKSNEVTKDNVQLKSYQEGLSKAAFTDQEATVMFKKHTNRSYFEVEGS